MTNFVIQNFRNLQNVNDNNMDNFYANTSQQLTAYFPAIPCIGNGIGSIFTNFGQSGTSNSFTFLAGTFRFPDQSVTFFTSITPTEPCFAQYAGATVSVTCPTGSSPQYYIVAVLSFSSLDSFNVQTSVIVSTTAMTLAQIATEANPSAYLPICAITNIAGVYNVFLDSNCAYNYGVAIQSAFLDITDDLSTGDVNIGGRISNGSTSIYAKDAGEILLKSSFNTLNPQQLILNGSAGAILNTIWGGSTSAQTYLSLAAIGGGYSLATTEADGTTVNNGIVGQYGYRTRLLGNLATLTTATDSIAVLGDFPVTFASDTGYQIFPNGTIMQWGFASPASGDAITLPIAFNSANYGVIIMGVGSTVPGIICNVNTWGETGFYPVVTTVSGTLVSGAIIMYIAFGG